MKTLTHNQILVAIYSLFAILIACYLICGYIGKRVRISKELYRPHVFMALLTVFTAGVTSYIASLLAGLDPVRREPSVALHVHIVSSILFSVSIIAMLVVNGRAFPRIHKRLVRATALFLALMIISSLFFI